MKGMVSIRSNACIRANQMGAFVLIKYMHLYTTIAWIRVMRKDGFGTSLIVAVPTCPQLLHPKR